MTCPAHPITDRRCVRPAGHDGQHNPHHPDDPWSSTVTPDEQALYDRFGYLPDPADVARVDARHREAVTRANPTPPPPPEPGPPVVITGWQIGTGHTVAHRFRHDNRRSICGWTDANPFRRIEPAPREARCSRCENATNSSKEHAA